MQNLSKEKKNPLNPNLSFKLSYMTDFLQGLINEKHKLKAILIENGWLELDSLHDYNIYNELYQQGKISDFINIKNS